jgi:hypothetical protein
MRLSTCTLLFILYVTLAVFQNIASILAVRFLGNDSIISSLALTGKDFILILICVTAGIAFCSDLLNGKIAVRKLAAVITLVSICAFVTVTTLQTSVEYLQDARLLLILPLSTLLGILLAWRLNISLIIRFMMSISIFVAISSWIEYALYLFWDEQFWITMDLENYYQFRDEDRSSSMHGGYGGVPGRFYSWDVIALGFQDPIRRLVSFVFVDPTILGHFLSFAYAIALFQRRYILAFFFFLTCAAGIAKGGLLVCLFATLFWAIGISIQSGNYFRISMISTAAVIAIGVAAYFGIGSQSMKNHVSGLLGPVSRISTAVLGQGVGTGGNRAFYREKQRGRDLEGNDAYDRAEFASESYVGSMIQQIGILGIVAYLCAFWINAPRQVVVPETLGLRVAALATILSSLASESAMSYSSTFAWLVLAAFAAAIDTSAFYSGRMFGELHINQIPEFPALRAVPPSPLQDEPIYGR